MNAGNTADAIPGILIEGVDYIGKSSVCDELAIMLRRERYTVEQGWCYLARDASILEVERQAKGCNDPAVRDMLYSAAIAVDLLALEHGHRDIVADVVVQDRHWLTQVGRNYFFGNTAGDPANDPIACAHRPFTHNVLLTSDRDAKLRRIMSREPRSPRDRFLAANPDVHQEYDLFLRTLLPESENWLILDVSDLSLPAVVASARDFLADTFPLRSEPSPAFAFGPRPYSRNGPSQKLDPSTTAAPVAKRRRSLD